MYHQQDNKQVAKTINIVGLYQGQKIALQTLVVTFDMAYCSAKNTI